MNDFIPPLEQEMLQHLRLRCRLHCKKILYTSLSLFLGHLLLFGNIGRLGTLSTSQMVFAQAGTTTNVEGKAEEKLKEKVVTRDKYGIMLSKILYIALWPLLVIAGFAMDNSMVYGSIFGFDTALWSLRNLMKNIANFALGFLFLYGIFRILIGKSDAKEMANLVKNTLIAGVLIQSSWFLMAAAVDISTIATYGIGGLPLSITGKATNEKDTKVTYLPNITVFVPVEDGTAAPVLFLGTESYTGEDKKRYTGRNISPCAIVTLDDGGKKEELIIGRAYINYSNKDKVLAETNEKICHYWGSVYRFKQEPIFLPPSDIRGGIDKSIITGQTAYNKEMGDFKGVFTPTKKENIKSMISEGKILQIVEGFQSRVFTGDGAGGAIPTTGTSKEPWGFDREYTWLRTQPGVQLTTLSNLLEKSKSYVGVFSALYESMINAGEITFSEKAATDGFFKSFLQTAYNVLYVAVLLLPLAVLAIVLMARVAILRVVIAASPIIILLHVFKKDIKVEAITGDKSDFALKNIGSLLLAPVLISFALSLSTVFMSILRQLKYGEEKGLPTNILGLFEVDIQGTGVDISKVLINVMGIGIVRFLLFRAIKQNQIGKAVGDKVQSLAQQAMMNAPIIPLGNGLSLNQIDPTSPTGILGTIDNKINTHLENSANKNMAELLKGMGLEKLADESALKRLEEDSKAGLADTFKDEAKRKAYFTNWGDDGRSTPPPIRWRNKNGDEREIEPQINDIISNPDALEHFMEYSKNMPDDKKTEAYEKILREADKSLISTIKNASDLETLKRLMKLTTPEQRTTLLEEKKDGRIFNNKKYTINEQATQGEAYLTETPST